jgi:hypothetical protein
MWVAAPTEGDAERAVVPTARRVWECEGLDMNATDVLIAAKEKVAQGWCQGSFGQIAAGNPLSLKHARAFCADGAIYAVLGNKAGQSVYFTVRDLFERCVVPSRSSIWEWNDTPGRTQAEVLAAFDKAIALSRQAA